MEIKGIIPPMVSPTLSRTGGVNESALRSYTEFLLESGVHGLFPCGSIGEFSSLPRDDRKTIIETVVEVATEVPVIAGCCGTAVGEVLALIKDAAAAGADAAVIVTPYYITTDAVGLEEFFETVATASPLPIILYNIPQRTGHTIPVESVCDLSEHDNIIGIKDSAGNPEYHFRLIRETPDNFTVMQGNSPLSVAALDIGTDALISGAANVFPASHVDLYDSYRAGNRKHSIQILNKITYPLMNSLSMIPISSGLKYYLSCVGFDIGPPLLPLPELTTKEKERIKSCYNQLLEEAE